MLHSLLQGIVPWVTATWFHFRRSYVDTCQALQWRNRSKSTSRCYASTLSTSDHYWVGCYRCQITVYRTEWYRIIKHFPKLYHRFSDTLNQEFGFLENPRWPPTCVGTHPTLRNILPSRISVRAIHFSLRRPKSLLAYLFAKGVTLLEPEDLRKLVVLSQHLMGYPKKTVSSMNLLTNLNMPSTLKMRAEKPLGWNVSRPGTICGNVPLTEWCYNLFSS